MAEVMGETEAAARRAQTLTRQLLTFSRGGAPMKSLIDLAAVVRESATFVGRGSSAVVHVQAAEGLWPVEADAGQLGQVVHNLVLNALEAMPGGGELRFTSTVQEEQAELRITDTGPGIPPELWDKIFRLYFTTKSEGSGIGLAMTFRVVQLHDGTIDFASEPGKGTTFVLRLPTAV